MIRAVLSECPPKNLHQGKRWSQYYKYKYYPVLYVSDSYYQDRKGDEIGKGDKYDWPDIYRADYKEPVPQAKIVLKKPTRGMYLVTIGFTDGTRIVKKIMIEKSQ